MKDIRLIGVGNALVDIEYKISEELLHQLEVTKGAMALIDVERRTEIAKKLKNLDAHLCSGGSVANSIIAFAQFGGKGAFSSILGNDAEGRFYADEFAALDIELQAPFIDGEHTGTCTVLVTPDSERTLNTTLAVNELYSRDNISESLIAASRWLYIEGYKLTSEQGFEAADVAAFYAKRHDTQIAVTCSDSFVVDFFGDRLRHILRDADLVFSNENEAMKLTSTGNADEAFAALCAEHPAAIVTMSDRGSHVAWDGRTERIPAYPVKPVDATGAGDMYAGAFFYGILHGHALAYAGRLASFAASRIVSQMGARLKESHLQVKESLLNTAERADG